MAREIEDSLDRNDQLVVQALAYADSLTGGLVLGNGNRKLPLQAGIHIDNGAVREGSYGDFLWARQRHTPTDLQIHVMPATTDEPGGVGELGVPVCAGAIATAYARATGTKPRRFPLNF